ncbi:MAG: hypothetical protein V4731_14490 [Pseudomonadota bacterium]
MIFLLFKSPAARRMALVAALLGSTVLVQACAVIAVVDTAASIAVGTVGLAADAAIGTVRIAGRAIGATADAVLPGPTSP